METRKKEHMFDRVKPETLQIDETGKKKRLPDFMIYFGILLQKLIQI